MHMSSGVCVLPTSELICPTLSISAASELCGFWCWPTFVLICPTISFSVASDASHLSTQLRLCLEHSL